MAIHDALRSTWSVRHETGVELADRAFENLTDNCYAICVEHFPANAGYTFRATRLTGPIEGRSFTIARGDFVATVSLQRFHPAGQPHRQEIRLVATLHERQPAPDVTPHRWAIVAPALGSTGLMTVGVASATSVSAMTLAMFFIPMMVAMRLGVLMWVASQFHRKARREALALAAAPSDTPTTSMETVRWQSALRALADQQNYVRTRITTQPFRTMAPLSAVPAEVA